MTDSFFKDSEKDNPTGDIPGLNDDTGKNKTENQAKESFATEEGRMAAIMAYIPILCFIPLLNMKDNKEAQFHARQGVLLFLVEIIAMVFLIDKISNMVFTGILMLALALSCVGIYFALQGKNYRLPIIGDLADKTKEFIEN